jgi:hypothetical protein
VAAAAPDAIGREYADADDTRYGAMFGQPVMVYAADGARLARTLNRARSRGVLATIFTADLFATGNDVDNRAAVAAVAGDDLDLVGLAVHGPRNAVDKVVKGARMHP